MAMTALAWNLKAWFGLLMPDYTEGLKVIRMEFRHFTRAFKGIAGVSPREYRRNMSPRNGNTRVMAKRDRLRTSGIRIPTRGPRWEARR